MNTRVAAPLGLLVVCASLAAVTAHAQTYPASRPIRVIVPYVPGGGVDFVGRAVAQKLSETWNHPVVVENRPGAGTNIGSELVARAAPDGHTLLVGGVPNSVNMTLYQKPGYDFVKDFAPVTQISTAPNILVIHPSVPVRTVKDLIAFAKARKGMLTFGSAGMGSSNHLSGELFRIMADVDIIHVPYKGGGAAVTDLIGGQISMYFGTTPSSVPFVRTGRLRALGVTSAKRSPSVPDVPTISEAGLPGFEQSAWHGLLAPAGTPDAIVAKLHGDVTRFLKSPEVSDRLGAQGVDVVASSPAELAAWIRQDVAKYAKLVKAAGLKAE
jgi:tripartite-type tricarboxylate transporter receptor subunit TctC